VRRVVGADAARARARRRIVRVHRARFDARERSPFRALRVRAERRRDRRAAARVARAPAIARKVVVDVRVDGND
jgi:hypothetical protein